MFVMYEVKKLFGGHSKKVEIFDCMPPVFGALIYNGSWIRLFQGNL